MTLWRYFTIIIGVKTIVVAHPAAKDFDALPADVREAIEKAVCELAIEGSGDVKALAGRHGLYRLRVGRYRVIFTQSATQILVVQVGKRETTTYR